MTHDTTSKSDIDASLKAVRKGRLASIRTRDDLQRLADAITVDVETTPEGPLLHVTYDDYESVYPDWKRRYTLSGRDATLKVTRSDIDFPTRRGFRDRHHDRNPTPVDHFVFGNPFSAPAMYLHAARQEVIDAKGGPFTWDDIRFGREASASVEERITRAFREAFVPILSPMTLRILSAMADCGRFHQAVYAATLASAGPERICDFLERNPIIGIAVLDHEEAFRALEEGVSDIEAFEIAKKAEAGDGEGRRPLRNWNKALLAKATRMRLANALSHPDELLDVLPRLPLEWVPEAPEEIDAMGFVHSLRYWNDRDVRFPKRSYAESIPGCRGKWRPYMERLLATVGKAYRKAWLKRDSDGMMGPAKSMGDHFHQDLAAPLALMFPDKAPNLHRIHMNALRGVMLEGRSTILPYASACLVEGMDLAGRFALLRRQKEAKPAIVGAVMRYQAGGTMLGDRVDDPDGFLFRCTGGKVTLIKVQRPLHPWSSDGPEAVAGIVDDPRLISDVPDYILIGDRDPTSEVPVFAYRFDAATHEGMIDLVFEVETDGSACVDVLGTVSEALGCGRDDIGRIALQRLGLTERYAQARFGRYLGLCSSHAGTPESMREVLRAWKPVLPHRLRTDDLEELAVLIDAEVVKFEVANPKHAIDHVVDTAETISRFRSETIELRQPTFEEKARALIESMREPLAKMPDEAKRKLREDIRQNPEMQPFMALGLAELLGSVEAS